MSAYERAIELSSEIEMLESSIRVLEEKVGRLEGDRLVRANQRLATAQERLPELVAEFLAAEAEHGKTISTDSQAIRAARG